MEGGHALSCAVSALRSLPIGMRRERSTAIRRCFSNRATSWQRSLDVYVYTEDMANKMNGIDP